VVQIVTLKERKERAVRQRREAAEAVIADLKRYAREHGGRYFLFGSVARGEVRRTSDIDIIVDFHSSDEPSAVRFAEESCSRHGIGSDIHPLRFLSEKFLARVTPDLLELS
jgi:predicted nucleotidyltransferase